MLYYSQYGTDNPLTNFGGPRALISDEGREKPNSAHMLYYSQYGTDNPLTNFGGPRALISDGGEIRRCLQASVLQGRVLKHHDKELKLAGFGAYSVRLWSTRRNKKEDSPYVL
jgi:hypothetical protein